MERKDNQNKENQPAHWNEEQENRQNGQMNNDQQEGTGQKQSVQNQPGQAGRNQQTPDRQNENPGQQRGARESQDTFSQTGQGNINVDKQQARNTLTPDQLQTDRGYVEMYGDRNVDHLQNPNRYNIKWQENKPNKTNEEEGNSARSGNKSGQQSSDQWNAGL
jgi:hypothetical protein